MNKYLRNEFKIHNSLDFTRFINDTYLFKNNHNNNLIKD